MEQVIPQSISVNGTEFTYIEQGAGDPVIFVHGSLGDYRAWGSQIEPFSEKYRVIAYSRRYHYPNPWTGTGTDYTVTRHVEDLTRLIETLGLNPVHIVGNSFGALTALVTAIKRPDLLKKVVVGEPPIIAWLKDIPGGQPYMEEFLRTTWQPASRAFLTGNLEEGVRLFIDAVSGEPGFFEKAPQAVKQRMLDNARSLSAETASPGYFYDPGVQLVKKITTPMLLLRGEHSPQMFHLIMDRLAALIAGAQAATIPNASHSMASNNPSVYNQMVMDFLGGS